MDERKERGEIMKKKSDQTLKEKLLECFPKTRLNSEGLPQQSAKNAGIIQLPF